MSTQNTVVCLGEVLWDLLPCGPQLGGALANVAVMLQALGDNGVLVSSVGHDSFGQQAIDILQQRTLNLEYISVDSNHATGTVSVLLSQEGVATYNIHENVAWDYLAMKKGLALLARSADAVCFGTLAQRSMETRETIRTFIKTTAPACVRVFDVNLRSPYFTPEVIRWSLEHATIVKMNHEEVASIADCADAPALHSDAKQLAHHLLERFPIELVAITRGGNGSLIVTRHECFDHPGIAVNVVDTVGAGDAFTAALTHHYLRHASVRVLSEAGNRWGSWVAGQLGGMPEVPESLRRYLDHQIAASEK
ncbi:MAG TPA: carbohydrate kinase [Acidobacteriaceae bacterium]|nr:carbohydrate kinase [Acidobacteriaceae bacterium]